MDVPRRRHRNGAGQMPAQSSTTSRTYSTIAVPTVLTFLRSKKRIKKYSQKFAFYSVIRYYFYTEQYDCLISRYLLRQQ